MQEFIGKVVVVDVASMFVFLGRLVDVGEKTVTLRNADAHDLRDSTTTREAYVREARLHGVQPNRDQVLVRMDQVVSVSPLDAIVA